MLWGEKTGQVVKKSIWEFHHVQNKKQMQRNVSRVGSQWKGPFACLYWCSQPIVVVSLLYRRPRRHSLVYLHTPFPGKNELDALWKWCVYTASQWVCDGVCVYICMLIIYIYISPIMIIHHKLCRMQPKAVLTATTAGTTPDSTCICTCSLFWKGEKC